MPRRRRDTERDDLDAEAEALAEDFDGLTARERMFMRGLYGVAASRYDDLFDED